MPRLNSSKIVQRLDILWWFVDHLNSYIQLKDISSKKKCQGIFIRENHCCLPTLFLMSVKTPMCASASWPNFILRQVADVTLMSLLSDNGSKSHCPFSLIQKEKFASDMPLVWPKEMTYSVIYWQARDKNINSPP